MIEPVQLKDNIKDITVKYIFVKNWKWVDQLDKEHYNGAPVEGRVYRALYNNKTESYRLVISEAPINGLLIESLECKNGMFGSIHECTVITKSNILDLPIKGEDFDKIENWVDTNNSDLFKPASNSEVPENFPIIVLQGFTKHQKEMEEAERLAKMIDVLSDLDAVNSIQFELVSELIDITISQNILKNEDGLELSEHAGLGMNISKALDHINKYASSNRRVNEDRGDLVKAVCHLMLELERRIILDLDNE